MERDSLMFAGVIVVLAATLSIGALSQPEDAGEPETFEVTAYCVKGITKSGARVREGMAAADQRVLPLGSTIEVSGSGEWDGVYTVMDTGSAVKGRILDLYLRDCQEALELGRRDALVRVIRRGWTPDALPRATAEEETATR